jgi:hypothetical protein
MNAAIPAIEADRLSRAFDQHIAGEVVWEDVEGDRASYPMGHAPLCGRRCWREGEQSEIGIFLDAVMTSCPRKK